VTKKVIDKAAYDDLLRQLRADSEIARLELQRVATDDFDLDALLDLEERLLNDAALLWKELDPARKVWLRGSSSPPACPTTGSALEPPQLAVFSATSMDRVAVLGEW